MGMTNEEAKHKLDFLKKAYQKLIDEKADSGKLVGDGVRGEWKAETPLDEVYKDMIESLDIAIKALDQQPCETIHGSTYGGVSWGGTYKPQQPCEDCISILNRIMEYTYGMLTTEKYGLQHLIKSMMDELSSVTPTRPNGKWKRISPAGIYECTNCNQVIMTSDIDCYKYCHGCGARMEVNADDNNVT